MHIYYQWSWIQYEKYNNTIQKYDGQTKVKL